MRPGRRFGLLAALGLILAGSWLSAGALEDEWMTASEIAGKATGGDQTRSAFTQHVRDLDPDQLSRFAFGNRIFATSWVTAPASVEQFDGLGPFFTKRSCSGCHVRDGRGQPPQGPDDRTSSTIAKLVRVGPDGATGPDPVYGEQLSEQALRGLKPEGRVAIRWEERAFLYPDESRVMLRRPVGEVVDLGYGPLDARTRYSVRMPPAVIGSGLLDLVSDTDLAALEDSGDANLDGLSGRVHWIGASGTSGRRAGRFGWKAIQPTARAQITTALAGDMGITTPLRPTTDATAAQTEALRRPTGGAPELSGHALESLEFYISTLTVPARRRVTDPQVLRGAKQFVETGCAGCHAPVLHTGESPVTALSRQTIHPFTDLLLHDMGPDLADGMPEGDARPSEWRTAPLWGLGLAEHVGGHRFLLHDGRARSPEEAILWHGGEGEASRRSFAGLSAAARNELLFFLESL